MRQRVFLYVSAAKTWKLNSLSILFAFCIFNICWAIVSRQRPSKFYIQQVRHCIFMLPSFQMKWLDLVSSFTSRNFLIEGKTEASFGCMPVKSVWITKKLVEDGCFEKGSTFATIRYTVQRATEAAMQKAEQSWMSILAVGRNSAWMNLSPVSSNKG